MPFGLLLYAIVLNFNSLNTVRCNDCNEKAFQLSNIRYLARLYVPVKITQSLLIYSSNGNLFLVDFQIRLYLKLPLFAIYPNSDVLCYMGQRVFLYILLMVLVLAKVISI